MKDKPESKRGWRILRRLLIALAVFATVVAALYTEEDWRGKRAWENYKRELETKGEKLNWQAFVPPAEPSDRNFATAPIVSNILNGRIWVSPDSGDGGPNIRPAAGRGGYAVWRVYPADLEAWQNYYRHRTSANAAKGFPVAAQRQTPAKDVLLALSKYDGAIRELRRASLRPDANLPLPYEEGVSVCATALLRDLAAYKRCTRLLRLRACAELADGESAKALDDVKLLLRLNDSIRNSPFLITHLVRIAMMAVTMQPIWEGLAEHKWSDGQLMALDVELGKENFPADYELAMRGERAFAIAAWENMRRRREVISISKTGYATNKWGSLLPSAFYYRNELAYARLVQERLLPLANTNSRIVSPTAMRRAAAAISTARKHYSLYGMEAAMTARALDTAVAKFAAAQTVVDLARIACALERYRLAHGVYPESLDALAPQFIEKMPRDIINGQPLHYRRTGNGKFVLYSVGWDGKDDGGHASGVSYDKGDWVWQN